MCADARAARGRSAIAGWVGGWCSAAPCSICTAGAGSCAADSDAASPRVAFSRARTVGVPGAMVCLSRYGMRFLTSRRCRGADSRLASFIMHDMTLCAPPCVQCGAGSAPIVSCVFHCLCAFCVAAGPRAVHFYDTCTGTCRVKSESDGSFQSSIRPCGIWAGWHGRGWQGAC